MADTIVTMKQLTGELEKQSRYAKDIQKAYKDIASEAGKISASIGGSGGQNVMGNSLAKFTGGEKFQMAMAGAQGLFNLGAGMMPNTAAVIQHATGYYNAGVMQGVGGPTQANMYARMNAGLGKFGVQSPQAAAQLAQFYGARGVNIGSAYEGNLTRAVGGAARFYNMDSNLAAQALENLTAGAGGQSRNLLQQLGIFTADPYTGKVKNQRQLFDEIHGRLTAGRGPASVTDVQESFRRGALGNFLKNSGMDENQQQMFYLSELYRAENGKSLDLSNEKQVSAAMKNFEKKGYINPQQQLNQIAASEAGVLQASQGSYIQGLKDAVPVIQGLNDAAGKLGATFGQLKAAIDAISSTNAGSAAKNAVGDIGNGLLTVAGAALGSSAGSALTRGAATTAAKIASSPIGKGVGVLGGVAGAAGVVTSSMGSYDAAKKADGWGVAGNILGATASGALSGASIGMLFGPGGAGVGALIGGGIGLVSSGVSALFGAQGGAAMGAGSGAASTSTTGTKGAPAFARPATGTITSKYGPRTPPTPTASRFHKGVDIGNSKGTPIVASAEGKVIFAGWKGAFGNHVILEHSGGYQTSYSHMSSIKVTVGQKLNQGNQVGSMGTTGNSTGNHLHFEVKKNGSNVDPATVVPGLGGGGGTATVTNTQPDSTAASGSADAKGKSHTAIGQSVSGGTIGNMSFSSNTVGEYGNGYGTSPGFMASSSGTGSKGKAVPGDAGSGGPADSGGMISGPTRTMGHGNSIVINVNVQKASDAEARRFAGMVKDILENESNITKIGRA